MPGNARSDGADRPPEELSNMRDHIAVAHFHAHDRASRGRRSGSQERSFAFQEAGKPVQLTQVHTDEIGTALRAKSAKLQIPRPAWRRWCNGSTTDCGPVCSGSKPPRLPERGNC